MRLGVARGEQRVQLAELIGVLLRVREAGNRAGTNGLAQARGSGGPIDRQRRGGRHVELARIMAPRIECDAYREHHQPDDQHKQQAAGGPPDHGATAAERCIHL